MEGAGVGARQEHIRGQFFSLAFRLLVPGTIFGLIRTWLTGHADVLFHLPALNLAPMEALADQQQIRLRVLVIANEAPPQTDKM